MRNNVRKKMRLICLLFAMVLLAGVPAAAKDRKNQKAAAENVVKKEMVCKTNGTFNDLFLKTSNLNVMNKLLPSVKSLITLAALLCFLFQASAAQAQKVSLSVRNATVKAAIERLQKDYGYSFVIKTKDADVNKKITLDVENEEIGTVVEKMFAGQNVVSSVEGKMIAIMSAPAKRDSAARASANAVVKGVVKDSAGNPVTGATVIVDGTTIGATTDLLECGAVIKPSFCGPCFGAGDVPANNGLSLRHTTRNFPNREGSKPGDGQLSGVVLMDARSIAATARNHGVLTPATEVDYVPPKQGKRTFDTQVYDRRVYFGFGHPQPEAALKFGPNIAEWPPIPALADNLLMQVASVLRDPVTTTDELIPSGETSSYRSNPLGLAEFTLSRKDPAYVGRAKAVQAEEAARRAGQGDAALLAKIRAVPGCEALTWDDVQLASTIFAVKPGDGSAREQAASCQRVLGAGANIVNEYATKRYRSNLINWGMLPFQLNGAAPFGLGDYILIPHVREALKGDLQNIPAYVLGEEVKPFALYMAPLTSDEREILADGCLINYYKH